MINAYRIRDVLQQHRRVDPDLALLKHVHVERDERVAFDEGQALSQRRRGKEKGGQ